MVLSLGSAGKGDMKYLMSIVKPYISVIIDITQRYLEAYNDMNELVKEYSYLVQKTQAEGLVILNHDNYRIRSLSKQCRSAVKYFSLQTETDAYAWNIDRLEGGTSFKNNLSDNPKFIKYFGQHHIQAFLAASIIKKYVAKISAK